MIYINRIFYIAALLIITSYSPALAASYCGAWGTTGGGSSPWTVSSSIEGTASCDNADIAACITAATSGDTINVPTGTCTWTARINILEAKTIALIGNGSSNTIISYAGPMIRSSSPNSRISGFRFNLTDSGAAPIVEMRNTGWRVDHNYFDNQTGTTKEGVVASGTDMDMLPEGVIDNNTFNECRVSSDGMGTFAKRNIVWTEDSYIGTANSVYVEDNVITRTTATTAVDANSAGSYVFRYNTVAGVPTMVHSSQGDRGSKNWEVYGNTFTFINTGFNYIGFMRGGTGMYFGNYVTGPLSGSYIIALDDDRLVESRGIYGKCDGDAPYNYDGSSDNGWPCRDQIGRGKDSSLSSATDMKDQASVPAYFWVNKRSTGADVLGGNVNGSENWIQNNRDYYDYAASFDGTSGTGCGTLASRPATCTTGVGYWATAQSCSDLTGLVGVAPATPISGTLYKCTATNTWTAHYTPYTYPHPLRNEAATTYAATITSAGSGTGTVTSSPEGISCGATCEYSFNSGQEVILTATATLPNYFVGWSGTGGCTGTSTCVLTMSAAKAATATFSRYGTATIGAGGSMTIGSGGSLTLQ